MALDVARKPENCRLSLYLAVAFLWPFRLAAQTVGRTDTALGAFYRRRRAMLGAPKAMVATAAKMARIVYPMLRDKRAYVDRRATAAATLFLTRLRLSALLL